MVEIKERNKVRNSQKFYLCIKVAASRHNAKDQLKIILALTDNSCIDICLITRIFEKLYLSKLVWNVLNFLLLWPVYLIYTQNKTKSATWYSTTWKKCVNMKVCNMKKLHYGKMQPWKDRSIIWVQHERLSWENVLWKEYNMRKVVQGKGAT